MTHSREQDPAWAAVRAVQAAHGRELLLRFGAHGLDIDWFDTPDGRVPGLVFHVPTADEGGERGPGEAEVDVIEVDTDDGPRVVPVRFVATPTTTFEA